MDDAQGTPPADPPANDGQRDQDAIAEARLKKIEELARNTRTLWFVLLSFLGFCAVTLAGVEDADFFAFGAETDLPLLGVAVPTDSFFSAGAFLAAALYIHFHLYLMQLPGLLAKLPRFVQRHPVEERHYPWLVIDAAMLLRRIPGGFRGIPRLMRRRFERRWLGTRNAMGPRARPRGLPLLVLTLAAVFVWAAGPAIVAWFWVLAMPTRLPLLVHWIALLLILCLYVSIQSVRSLAPLMSRGLLLSARKKPVDPERSNAPWIGPLARIASFSLLAVFIGWASVNRVETTTADLQQARIAEEPVDWQDHDIAKDEFRGQFTARMRAEYGDRDAWREDWEQKFEVEWSSRRAAYIARIRSKNLDGFDLRGADLRDSFLVGVSLVGAKLDGANLAGARLEGAVLEDASLRHQTSLHRADLTRATLTRAKLEGADLRVASMMRADFTDATMDGASFAASILEGVNLTRASMQGVNLRRANLQGALGLTQEQLNGALGDVGTVLPGSLYIYNCWTDEFVENLTHLPLLWEDQEAAQFLRCRGGREPERTGSNVFSKG